MAQRVGAGQLQSAGEFLIEDRQELGGEFFVILFRTATAARRRLEIFHGLGVLLLLRRFDESQQRSPRSFAAQRIGRNRRHLPRRRRLWRGEARNLRKRRG